MKKVILFILLISIMSFKANAQMTGGLKGGINLSSQKWKIEAMGQSDSESFDGVGFHIGGYLNYSLSDVMSLQPELLYNSLKIELEADGFAEDITLNYISVPVLLGYGFNDNQFVLQAGPQLGVLVSTDPSEFKDEDFVTGMDFSFAFGAMLNFNKFNVTMHYALGISNIVDDTFSDVLESVLGFPIDFSMKNNNLQLSVGYRLFGE